MPDDVSSRKAALRAQHRARRRAMSGSEVVRATDGLTHHLTLLTERLDARYVAAYLPAAAEPDLRPWLAWAHERGIRVILPVARDDGTLDWVPGSTPLGVVAEQPGRLGVPEAIGPRLGPRTVAGVDLIIAPAASVDRTGMRMGWGRGYYDRMLGSLQPRPPVYAVVFDSELVDEVPTEVHDKPVNGVVTPSGIVDIQPGA